MCTEMTIIGCDWCMQFLTKIMKRLNNEVEVRLMKEVENVI